MVNSPDLGNAGKMWGGKLGGTIAKGLGLGSRKAGEKVGKQIGKALGGLIKFKKGGMVKKTGPAIVHQGELVVPKHLVKDVSKTLKNKIKANQKK